jgi:hypothetical protein
MLGGEVSRDGRFAGAKIADDLNSPIEITLRPTMDYYCRLLGADGRQLPNHPVLASVRVGREQNARTAFPTSIEGLRVKTTTDDQGNYTLVGLLRNMIPSVHIPSTEDEELIESPQPRRVAPGS